MISKGLNNLLHMSKYLPYCISIVSRSKFENHIVWEWISTWISSCKSKSQHGCCTPFRKLIKLRPIYQNDSFKWSSVIALNLSIFFNLWKKILSLSSNSDQAYQSVLHCSVMNQVNVLHQRKLPCLVCASELMICSGIKSISWPRNVSRFSRNLVDDNKLS